MITKMNKRGALEMSITTIVIVVIAVAALILGLVLVRNIFQGATVSVDTINDQVLSEIERAFQSSDSFLFVRLPAEKMAYIEPGTNLGVVLGATTIDGSAVFEGSDAKLSYKVTFEDNGCDVELSSPDEGSDTEFDRIQGSAAGAIVLLSANAGAGACENAAKVTIELDQEGEGTVARESFFVQVARGGLFG